MNIVVIRHGETEWSRELRHTGRTDIPLTDKGQQEARTLAPVLAVHDFTRVLVSPLIRARVTCDLAGFGARAAVTDDLQEWDYGEYDGLTRVQICQSRPEWNLWQEGPLGGETITDVSRRADRVLIEIADNNGDVLLFAHGHILRVLTARWLGLTGSAGQYFALQPATLSILGHEHDYRCITVWNALPHKDVWSLLK